MYPSNNISPQKPARPARRLAHLAFAFSLAASLAGCGQDAPVSLNADARARIDTLYTRQARSMRVELDSLCQSMFEAEVDRAVDSILPIRRAEEIRLRQRIPVQQ